MKDRAFTLIELLIAGLLLPALSMAKAKAKQIKCLGGLKQSQLAHLLYVDDNDGKVLMNTLWKLRTAGKFSSLAWVSKGCSKPTNPRVIMIPWIRGTLMLVSH